MAQINISQTGTAGVSTPENGVVAIFANTADSGKLYYKFSDGTISPVDTGSTSGGDSGTSGTSGAAGDSGTSGTSGEAGTSGTTGDSGTSGTSGTGSGDSGTSGTSGEAGTSGTNGEDGTSGTSGEAGTSGTSGTGSGDSGTSGTSGEAGTSGTNGEDGTSGTSGASGGAGTSGTDGDSGTSGTDGNSGTSGTAGPDGNSGTSGTDGNSGTSGTTGDSGTAGTSGTSGDEGTSGTSGEGTSGTSGEGTSGTSGNDGTSGTGGAGTSGTSGADGTSGTGVTGTSGTSGEGTSGTSGATGASGTSGTSGAGGGGGGVSTVFNNEVRYVAYDASTNYVEIKSSGTLYAGLSWLRSGTTITITSTAHGLTTGDYVVVRNMGATDYVYGAISNVSTNSFDITNAVNSGDTSGTEGAYIPAAKVTTSDDTDTVLASPSAGNIQISYVRVVYGGGLLFNSDYRLTTPQGITNGVGGNTSFKTQAAPIVTAYYANGNYNSSATPSIENNSGGTDFDEVYISAGLQSGQQNIIVYQF